MKIKNLNLHLENFKPNAKKLTRVIPTAFLIASFALTPVTAQAAVSNDDILGDAQVQEDRTDIKTNDGVEIAEYFDGYDYYGCATVSLEDIEKAIIMSDVLNAANNGNLEDINTTRNEVMGLNIYDLYNEYQADSNRFAYAHQQERSAMDAYLTFSSKTVVTHIQDELSNLVASLITEQGQQVTMYPIVIINNNEVSCIVGINGNTQKIVLHGEKVNELQYQCNGLMRHYNIALCSINGISQNYEDTFAYNGVRKSTGESVWLSLENQGIKEELRTAIASARELETREALELTTEDPYAYRYLSYEEALELQGQGFYVPDLNHVVVQDITINRVPKMEYNK